MKYLKSDVMMGFLNNLKDSISDRIKATPVIKATMMGPRAVGKTSIMASIFSDTKESIAGTQLYFRPSEVSSHDLINKRLALMEIFVQRTGLADLPQTGAIAASNTVTQFCFEMGFAGRKKTVDIEIKDFPGEYLTSKPQDVSNYIAESHVVIIAIDTPYLMEEDGVYNNEKNDVERVTKFLTNHQNDIKDKLILLVPLKCERYFHDSNMDLVNNKVVSAYNELIEFCKNSNIACAITPIQTLGGVEFDGFKDNMGVVSGITKLSKFRFYGENLEYRPIFCVQPLYYLLTYVANYYAWSESHPKNFFEKMKSSLVSSLKNNDEFFFEIKKMSRNIIADKMGYSIVVSNSILNIK